MRGKKILYILTSILILSSVPLSLVFVESVTIDNFYVLIAIILTFLLLGLIAFSFTFKAFRWYRLSTTVVVFTGATIGFLLGFRNGRFSSPWRWDEVSPGNSQLYIDWCVAIIAWSIFLVFGLVLLLFGYYTKTKLVRKADSRINVIVEDGDFDFSIDEYLSIHKKLFDGIFESAGKFKTRKMGRREKILKGDTVGYEHPIVVAERLKIAFEDERNSDFNSMQSSQQLERIAYFVSKVWKIHAFDDGNTRTTVVFTIRYLNSIGFHVDNEPFKKNAVFFRNSLVRANYSNQKQGIVATQKFLEQFFDNLLFNGKHPLDNKILKIGKQHRY
jgi:fido (protein-threonine AMPylation protein)